MKWFRWYRGTAERAKFRVIASLVSKPESAVSLTDVLAVWVALLEDAGNASHWGYVTRDATYIATLLDLGADEVQAMLDGMIEEEMIEPCAKSQKSGRYHIVNWEKYQFVSDTDPTAPIRQKRYREKRKSNAFQTRTDTDTDTDTDNKKEKKPMQRSLPENWTLSEQDVVYAKSKGWAKERVTSEGERFKNYYLTNGKAHKDWHRAWCKWVTSPYQTSQKASEGNGKLNVHQAADAQLEQFRAIINGGPSRLRDGAGESNVRLLPAGRREQS